MRSKFGNEFYTKFWTGETVQEFKAAYRTAGWRVVEGSPSLDGRGYHAAAQGGGYEAVITVTKGRPYVVDHGTPAYHGSIAYKG